MSSWPSFIRSTYWASVVGSSPCVVVNEATASRASRFSESVTRPSFRTVPNSRQRVA